jgi:NADH dehydrogenase
MKTIEDALKIRRRVFGAFEMAESADDPDERARWLSFALVGAGPTGVELAGQIREVATKTLRREYRHIQPEDCKVLLFDGGSAPLAMFGEKLSGLAARQLGKLGVELHMGSLVTNVDYGGLEVKDHDGNVTRYTAGTILWTAGVAAPPLAAMVAKATGAGQDRAGRLLCGPDLSLPGHPDILVAGDMMSLDKLSGVAEVAMQTGLYAGRRITRESAGETYDKPFKYHDLGSAAYISRGHAVVSAFKMHFSGFPGWVMWLFIHIGFLTGFRNRIGALFSWWFAFTRDLRRERTFTIDDLPVGSGPYSALPGTAARAADVPRQAGAPEPRLAEEHATRRQPG